MVECMCQLCGDDGLVYRKDERGYEFPYRCTCPAGQKMAEPQYLKRDKEKKRPFTVPEWNEPKTEKPRVSGRDRAAGVERDDEQ